MPGTPSGKSFVFDVPHAGGGGYSYAKTTPYASALEREELGAQRAREDREQQSFELAKKREEREQARFERQQRNEDLIDQAQELIDTKLGDPATMKHQDIYEKIMGNPLIHRARATMGGRQIVDGLLKQYHDAHQDYVNSWKQIANNYGYTGDVMGLPQNPDGTIHWQKALNEHLNPALERRQAMIQQKMMDELAKADQAGYAILEMTDPNTGKTKVELKKKSLDDIFGKKPNDTTKAEPVDTEQ